MIVNKTRPDGTLRFGKIAVFHSVLTIFLSINWENKIAAVHLIHSVCFSWCYEEFKSQAYLVIVCQPNQKCCENHLQCISS